MLLLENDRCTVVAQHGIGAPSTPPWQPSKHVLTHVHAEKRTFWQRPQQASASDSASLADLHTVVAAPLLDGPGNVIGALYGEHRRPRQRQTRSDARRLT